MKNKEEDKNGELVEKDFIEKKIENFNSKLKKILNGKTIDNLSEKDKDEIFDLGYDLYFFYVKEVNKIIKLFGYDEIPRNNLGFLLRNIFHHKLYDQYIKIFLKDINKSDKIKDIIKNITPENLDIFKYGEIDTVNIKLHYENLKKKLKTEEFSFYDKGASFYIYSPGYDEKNIKYPNYSFRYSFSIKNTNKAYNKFVNIFSKIAKKYKNLNWQAKFFASYNFGDQFHLYFDYGDIDEIKKIIKEFGEDEETKEFFNPEIRLEGQHINTNKGIGFSINKEGNSPANTVESFIYNFYKKYGDIKNIDDISTLISYLLKNKKDFEENPIFFSPDKNISMEDFTKKVLDFSESN